MQHCYLKLKEGYQKLSKSEKKIADYILENPKSIIKMPIDVLSQKCGTSKASVVRLSKTIGFSGYKELCMHLNADLQTESLKDYFYKDILPGDDISSIIKTVCENNTKAIKNTAAIINLQDFSKAVDLLCNAPRIDFYGVGNSGFSALDAQNKFLRINKISIAQTDPHSQILSASSLTKNDVAVLISYSGETKDIIETAEMVKDTGALIISITKFGRNTLSELSDIKLYNVSDEAFVRSGAMSSRIGQLCVIDMLFSAVTGKIYDKVKEHLDMTTDATRNKKRGNAQI